MNKVLVALLLFFSLQSVAPAKEPSTEQLVAAGTILTIDWLQTRYIARHPDQFHELNPLIGRHPSIGRVNVHFLSILLLGGWLIQNNICNNSCVTLYVGFGALNVARNFSIGIRMEF